MKTIFKSVLTLALVAGLGFVANAQSAINANVKANAEVLDALTLTKNTDVNFGTLSATTPGAVFLDPQGVANTYTGVSTTVGKLTILGSLGADVLVSWPATLTLTGDQAPTASTIIYQLLVYGNTSDNAAGASSLGTIGVANAADILLDGTTGNYFLYVGGGFPALLGQAPGIYEGTANFTVEYN